MSEFQHDSWRQCRLLLGEDQGLPIAYSEDPTSAYYDQAKDVYDVVQNATAEQKTIALFWADNADGKSPRPYNSFADAAIEAGLSRFYFGIHYRKTCDISLLQGQIIANNVAQKLTFKK